MNTVAIIISLIALVGAGFAFLRASSSHRILSKRIEKQKDTITNLEERLRRAEGSAGRNRRQTEEAQENTRRNQPRQEQPEREPKQKQRERRQDRPQQERQQPQERAQQPERAQQERQPRERSQQEGTISQQEAQDEAPSRQQRRRRGDNRRRQQQEGDPVAQRHVPLEFADGDLLAELEQQAAGQQPIPVPQAPAEAQFRGGKQYAIIPEDGLIRQHQLQQQPDSDSYIEVDVPAEGGNRTHYRFNLAGNHAFVISQGIDRLENAFLFEKPANRKVSQVVQQLDGVLARVGNGWKIEEKARIDFR